jgi:hypothetical protein
MRINCGVALPTVAKLLINPNLKKKKIISFNVINVRTLPALFVKIRLILNKNAKIFKIKIFNKFLKSFKFKNARNVKLKYKK